MFQEKVSRPLQSHSAKLSESQVSEILIGSQQSPYRTRQAHSEEDLPGCDVQTQKLNLDTAFGNLQTADPIPLVLWHPVPLHPMLIGYPQESQTGHNSSPLRLLLPESQHPQVERRAFFHFRPDLESQNQ